ncbi:hypothetical protein BRC90_11240 [Halobacteriales archaeon QS_4_69_34]|nr:MAG: hypothetical protein BRC90_11240 [Halobacteriales archaeon QS_4_69_34]
MAYTDNALTATIVALVLAAGVGLVVAGPTVAQDGDGGNVSSVPDSHEFDTSPGDGPLDSSADVTFDTENDELVVEGTVIGDDGCTDAALRSAVYSFENDTLTVTVGTYSAAGRGVGCTGALEPIDYTARFPVEDQPGRVNVVHAPNDTAQYTTAAEEGGRDPIGEASTPPRDHDDDGHFEDLNGDGAVDVLDVQLLFARLDGAASGDLGFDFDTDGEVTVVDVQALFADAT